jgi:hypothetical protein
MSDRLTKYRELAGALSNAAFREGMNEYKEGVYDVTLRKCAESHQRARAALDSHVEAMAAEVERLREDAARLDWLERPDHRLMLSMSDANGAQWFVAVRPGARHYGSSPRAAIDAARKEASDAEG